MAAQEIHTRALELVERPGIGNGHQPEGLVECAGLEARLRCRKRPLRTPRRVHGQRDRALQERCRGRDPTTSLGPTR
jgi:hypothetical protein